MLNNTYRTKIRTWSTVYYKWRNPNITEGLYSKLLLWIILQSQSLNKSEIKQLNNNKIGKNMQYQLLFVGGNFESRENQKEAFLPHEGFPHNNLAIPPCLVFWWVSIPWARSIQGTAHGAGVIISRSVMKLFRQKDELWGNFTWLEFL